MHRHCSVEPDNDLLDYELRLIETSWTSYSMQRKLTHAEDTTSMPF